MPGATNLVEIDLAEDRGAGDRGRSSRVGVRDGPSLRAHAPIRSPSDSVTLRFGRRATGAAPRARRVSRRAAGRPRGLPPRCGAGRGPTR